MPEVQDALIAARAFLANGGPAMWAIAAISVVALALILWKACSLLGRGAWSTGAARRAVNLAERGDVEAAAMAVAGLRTMRARIVAAAVAGAASMPEEAAREETARVAATELHAARSGLRALELIATIAPLLGLLGTVLGMIAAFRALQDAGSGADPAMLAGGIWEALLTTAAGMAVAIPATAALSWFESVIEGVRRDVEDAATRVFLAPLRRPATQALAAE